MKTFIILQHDAEMLYNYTLYKCTATLLKQHK